MLCFADFFEQASRAFRALKTRQQKNTAGRACKANIQRQLFTPISDNA